MNTMHNPPHPGSFIREVYLNPFKVSDRMAATSRQVPPSTFNRLVTGKSNISPELARNSYVFPRLWGAVQKAGLPCRVIMIDGRHETGLISMRFNVWHLPDNMREAIDLAE